MIIILNIAVCDDNMLVLKDLVSIIEKQYPEPHRVVEFSGSEQLIEYIEANSQYAVDIVITDIKMPAIDGIDMAKELKRICPRLKFIFITNYTEYIQDVFSVDPIYYIMKPVEPDILINAVSKAAKLLNEEDHNTIDVISSKKFIRIRISDIKYIESMGRTIFIHELFGNTKLNMKLDNFQKKLPDCFLRTHKSYIVNINMIKSVSNNSIELFSGEIIPVAKVKFFEIKRTILNYIGGSL